MTECINAYPIEQERGLEDRKTLDIEAILAEGKAVRIKPIGTSMSPLFASGRDLAVIAPICSNVTKSVRLKRNDIILYRHPGDNIFVLHRIYKVKKSEIYTLGDNQTVPDGPIPRELIKGIMIQMTRKGKTFNMSNPIYRMASAIWLLVRPVRPKIIRIYSKIKHKLKHKNY